VGDSYFNQIDIEKILLQTTPDKYGEYLMKRNHYGVHGKKSKKRGKKK
jgi:hypothetical protein